MLEHVKNSLQDVQNGKWEKLLKQNSVDIKFVVKTENHVKEENVQLQKLNVIEKQNVKKLLLKISENVENGCKKLQKQKNVKFKNVVDIEEDV